MMLHYVLVNLSFYFFGMVDGFTGLGLQVMFNSEQWQVREIKHLKLFLQHIDNLLPRLHVFVHDCPLTCKAKYPHTMESMNKSIK